MTLPMMTPSLLAIAQRWEAHALGYAAQVGAFLAEARRRPQDRALSIYGGTGGGGRPYDVVDSLALIEVSGLLLQSFPWLGYHFATGYDALRMQFASAFADPEVKGIVMSINSGGGDVAGCFGLVDWIAESRAATGKPIAGICSEFAYSAAYALASAADWISVPETGGVGSIGVLRVHWNWAAALGGAIPTLVQAGAHKTDGNPFGPLPEEVQAEWTAEVEDLRRLFAGRVARGRQAAGGSLTAAEVLATEARCYEGPAGTARAVELGLADQVAWPHDALAMVVKEMHRKTEKE